MRALDYYVGLITSPIILIRDEAKEEYENGQVLSQTKFEKPYIIKEIKAEGDKVVVVVEENTMINDTSWSDKEVNLFDGD